MYDNKLTPKQLGATISTVCRLSAPLLAAGLMLGSASVYAGSVIDNWSLAQGPLNAAGPSGFDCSQVGDTDPSIIGGERDMCATLSASAVGGDTVTAGVAGGVLSCVTNTSEGSCIVVWDGDDNSDSDAPFGLGSVGAEASLQICVNVTNVTANISLQFNITDMGSGSAIAIEPVNSGATNKYCVAEGDFLGAVDFNDLGSIKVTVTTVVAGGFTVELSPPGSTPITLASLEVLDGEIVWTTGMEVQNDHFNLYDYNPDTGSCVKLNSSDIMAVGDASDYSFTTNTSGLNDVWLEDVPNNGGSSTLRGPADAASYTTIHNAAKTLEDAGCN
jgi:hypothetical protein